MSFYLRTKSYTITEDGFMHNHQSALDNQREEDAINDLKNIKTSTEIAEKSLSKV